jgi:hypothetical protein
MMVEELEVLTLQSSNHSGRCCKLARARFGPGGSEAVRRFGPVLSKIERD